MLIVCRSPLGRPVQDYLDLYKEGCLDDFVSLLADKVNGMSETGSNVIIWIRLSFLSQI